MNEFIQRCIDLDKKEGFIRQIPVSDSDENYRILIDFLKSKGYKIKDYLLDIKDDDKVVAIIIDNRDRSVSKTNVTCMAGWSNCKRKPLNVKEIIDNYERFILDNDIEGYHEIITNK